MDVSILVLDDAVALTAIGVLDLLRKSDRLHQQLTGTDPTLRPRLVGTNRRRVRAMGGLVVACDATLSEVSQTDLVVVPALSEDVLRALTINAAAIAWLQRMYSNGADLASICTGAFLLGETGLLEGRSATTHWAFHDLFQTRYPGIRLLPQRIIVDEGRIITGGGATLFLNLAMYLVEKHLGAPTAQVAARTFLIDLNRGSQMAYAIFSGQKDHGDRKVLRAQTLIEERTGSPVSVNEVAEAVGMSQRSFVRRFKKATGNTPIEYIQRVRVEAAKKLLVEGTPQAFSEIVRQVGYEDVGSFRRVFHRHVGITPMSYRRRYQTRSARPTPSSS